MFKYRFVCSDKDFIVDKIEAMMMRDRPVKSIWGIDLYRSGIHFQRCDEIIKGFYLEEGEEESHHGAPIRVYFFGKFVEDAGNLFFDVFIYPSIFQAIFLIFMLFLAIAFDNIFGLIVTLLVESVFIKGYCDMMRDAYQILAVIFK